MWRNLIRDPRRRKSVAWRRRPETVCARAKGTRASERQSVFSRRRARTRAIIHPTREKKGDEKFQTHLLLLNLVST